MLSVLSLKTYLIRTNFREALISRFSRFVKNREIKDSLKTIKLLNLLDVLTVNNVYRLHALKFTHLWHKGLLPSLFDNLFQYASYRHTHNTRYASKQNFCKPRPRTNTGKQMFSYQAIDLWRDIPYSLKDLSTFSFAKEIKQYLLSEQYSKKFE